MENISVYSLGCLSVCSVWLFRHKIVPLFFTITTIALGFNSGFISFNALIIIIGYLIAAWAYFNNKVNRHFKTLLWWLIFALALLFSYHIVKGITNLQVVPHEIISDGAYPFSLWFNLDTIIASLGILLFANFAKSNKTSLAKILIVYVIAITVVALIAISLDVVKLDIKLPEFFASWLIINLLVSCVFEEVFFRYFVQGTLQKALSSYNYGDLIALLVATLLFTAKHFPGPPNYLITVFVAGLFYGYTYKITNRIEASIALHFLINTLHFFFFTYPILKDWIVS